MRIVIPSRHRAHILDANALRLFPDATVCVGASEEETYRKLTANVLVHPDTVTGMGPLRQWILEHAPADDARIFMVDDDAYALYSLVGMRARRIIDANSVLEVVENAGECADGAGAKIFGFNQAWDVRKFSPLKPVSLTGWVGGGFGVVDRKAVVFDTTLKLRADIDACLTSLLQHRIIYQDLRFALAHRRFDGAGGNAVSRSGATHEREIAYLQRKWGAHLTVRKSKTAVLLHVHVPRS